MRREVFTSTTLSHYKLIAGSISATPSPVDGESSSTPLPVFRAITVYNPFFKYLSKKSELKPNQTELQTLAKQKRT